MSLDLSSIDLSSIDMTNDERFSNSLIPVKKDNDIRHILSDNDEDTKLTTMADSYMNISKISYYSSSYIYEDGTSNRIQYYTSINNSSSKNYIYNDNYKYFNPYISLVYYNTNSTVEFSISHILRRLSVLESVHDTHMVIMNTIVLNNLKHLPYYMDKRYNDRKKSILNDIRKDKDPISSLYKLCQNTYNEVFGVKHNDHVLTRRALFKNKPQIANDRFRKSVYLTEAGRFDRIEYNYEMDLEAERVKKLLGLT